MPPITTSIWCRKGEMRPARTRWPGYAIATAMSIKQTAKGEAMSYQATAKKLAGYRSEIAKLRRKMRDAQASIEPGPVKDYELASARGSVRLSDLFGGKD